MNDMLGMKENPKSKHMKLYANLSQPISDAVIRYIEEIEAKRLPSEKHALG